MPVTQCGSEPVAVGLPDQIAFESQIGNVEAVPVALRTAAELLVATKRLHQCTAVTVQSQCSVTIIREYMDAAQHGWRVVNYL